MTLYAYVQGVPRNMEIQWRIRYRLFKYTFELVKWYIITVFYPFHKINSSRQNNIMVFLVLKVLIIPIWFLVVYIEHKEAIQFCRKPAIENIQFFILPNIDIQFLLEQTKILIVNEAFPSCHLKFCLKSISF